MKRIVVEAFEDPSRPSGGHAVILLRDIASMPDRPSIRLRPVEAEVDANARGLWRGGRLQPIVTRATPEGIELVIGPDVVGNPNLIAGTPVIIEIPDADVRGEFLWPSVAPPMAPRRRRIVVPRLARPILVPPAANDIEAPAADAPRRDDQVVKDIGNEAPSLAAAGAPAAAPGDSADTDAVTASKPGDGGAASGIAATGDTGSAASPDSSTPGPAEAAAEAPAEAPRMAVQDKALKAAPGTVAWKPAAAAGQSAPRRWRRYALLAAALAAGLYWHHARNAADPDMQLSDRFARPQPAKSVDAGTPPATSAAPPAAGVPRENGSSAATAGAVAVAAKPAAAQCAAAEIRSEPLAGGRMRISVTQRCKPNAEVRFVYGGAEQVTRLDGNGASVFVLDCFAGEAEPVEVRFADGGKQMVPVSALDLDRVSKVAVIWRAPVKLDLHAFEYAALPGARGHVWAGAAGTLEEAQRAVAADRKGHGYLSSASEAETSGDHVEVYTFVHTDEQASGSVGLALDYATRGESPSEDFCAAGKLAELPYTLVVKARATPPRREAGLIAAAPCGVKLGVDVRLRQAGLPVLKIKK